MKVNGELIAKLRKAKSWSQEELASESGLNLRTIQRIEGRSSASLQSKRAVATALGVAISDLDAVSAPISICPECRSDKVYRYKEEIPSGGAYGPNLLPKLNPSILSEAMMLPVVCGDCGYIRLFASQDALRKIESSKHWVQM